MLRARDEALILLELIYPSREMRDARSAWPAADPSCGRTPSSSSIRACWEPCAPSAAGVGGHDERRLLHAGSQLFQLEPLTYPTVMRRLLDNPDPWLRACACHAVAEAGVTALTPRVAALEQDPDPILREIAAAAAAKLQAASPWNN